MQVTGIFIRRLFFFFFFFFTFFLFDFVIYLVIFMDLLNAETKINAECACLYDCC